MLDTNEECMGEMAAMSVTCEQFGISEEEGYDLLISRSVELTMRSRRNFST
jgi:hypothetical protein